MNENMSQDKESRRIRLKKLHKKRAKKINTALTFIFCICLTLAIIINLIKPDVKFSSSENRVLSQKPELTISSILDGSFMTSFESYISDQFFMRDQWITLKVTLDKLLGKKESNGVYLGKDHYLMAKQDPIDKENLNRNLKAIQDFYARHTDLNICMTLVPNACYILKDYMPANAPVPNQAKEIAEIQNTLSNSVHFLDVTSALQLHSKEYIYYKTDHHWTTLGASYAFEAMAEGLGLTDASFAYNTYTVTNSFSGTLASKSGYHGASDYIQVYAAQDVEPNYVVSYADTMKQTSSLYDSSCLNEKDKYTVFFGGNHTRIDIQTTNENARALLVFKDSYANCFIPFLVPYYSEIIIIDPRYYYDSIDQIVERNSITDVLYLYNVNSFITDSTLADTLAPDETEEDSSAADTSNTTNSDSTANTTEEPNSDTETDESGSTVSDPDTSTSDNSYDTDASTTEDTNNTETDSTDIYNTDTYNNDTYNNDTYNNDTYNNDTYNNDTYNTDTYNNDIYNTDTYNTNNYFNA